MRQRMATQAATVEESSPDGKLSQSFVDEWLDVEKILRMNVVQGVRKEGKDDVYRESLRIPAFAQRNIA